MTFDTYITSVTQDEIVQLGRSIQKCIDDN